MSGRRERPRGVTGTRDVLVAAGVFVIGQQEAWLPFGGFANRVGPPAALSAAYLIASCALLWRRRAPLAVATAVSVALSVQFMVFGASDGLGALLPPLLAVFAAGRYCRASLHFYAASALIAASTTVHELRDPQFKFVGPTVVVWALLGASAAAGRLLRRRDAEVSHLSRRAAAIERDAERRAAQAAAGERLRLTQELHDLVGHGLSLLVLQLVAAQETLDAGALDDARERLGNAERTARTTMAEMRRLVAVSEPAAPPALEPQPGLPELTTLVDQVRQSGVRVDLDAQPGLVATPGIGLSVYRIVQEALTNVIRHAGQPTATRVSLRGDDRLLAVEVVDSGPVQHVRRAGTGRGLGGMRQRTELYGGTFSAGPCADGGFAVRAAFPLDGAAE